MDDFRSETGEPFDRLTRMGASMVETLEEHPEFGEDGDVRAIIFTTSVKDERSGVTLAGYENDEDAMNDLLQYVKVIFEANGVRFGVLPMNFG